MQRESIGRRLLSALAGSSPAFTPVPAADRLRTHSRRLLSALAGSSPAFSHGAGPDSFLSRPSLPSDTSHPAQTWPVEERRDQADQITMDPPPVEGSLLSFVKGADRDRLIAAGLHRTFAEKDLLLRQGEPPDKVLILLSGWVRVYVTGPGDVETMIALRGPGDLVGEQGALDGLDRTASVQALTAVDAVHLLSPQFVEVVRNNPAVAVGLLRQTSSRLREAETVLKEVTTLNVGQRVAAYLLELAQRGGTASPAGLELGMPLSQQDIAGRVGASLRGVARAMAILHDRGIIATTRRQVVIRRPDLLLQATSSRAGSDQISPS